MALPVTHIILITIVIPGRRDLYFQVVCVVTIIREHVFVFKKHTKFACVVVTCLDMFQYYPL